MRHCVVVACVLAVRIADACPDADRDERGECPTRKPATRPPEAKPDAKKPPAKKSLETSKPVEVKLDAKQSSERGKTVIDAGRPSRREDERLQSSVSVRNGRPGTKVMLDGEVVAGSVASIATTPGRHYIEIVWAGSPPTAKWIDLAVGETLAIEAPLTPLTGCPTGMVLGRGDLAMGAVTAASESASHKVRLSAYCIDTLEVTARDYATCVAAKGCTPASRKVVVAEGRDEFCTDEKTQPMHPMNCVDWTEANRYCGWAGKKLPTEAQWEFAARGSSARVFPWGNNAPTASYVNGCGQSCVETLKSVQNESVSLPLYSTDDRYATTAPVGRFKAGATAEGVHDLAGNVSEWNRDWFAPYAKQPQRDPVGPPSGANKVVRGGNWRTVTPSALRASTRLQYVPQTRSPFIGFRCVKED